MWIILANETCCFQTSLSCFDRQTRQRRNITKQKYYFKFTTVVFRVSHTTIFFWHYTFEVSVKAKLILNRDLSTTVF